MAVTLDPFTNIVGVSWGGMRFVAFMAARQSVDDGNQNDVTVTINPLIGNLLPNGGGAPDDQEIDWDITDVVVYQALRADQSTTSGDPIPGGIFDCVAVVNLDRTGIFNYTVDISPGSFPNVLIDTGTGWKRLQRANPRGLHVLGIPAEVSHTFSIHNVGEFVPGQVEPISATVTIDPETLQITVIGG